MSPSLRFTTVSFFGDMQTTETRYICGRNERLENRSCSGHGDGSPSSKLRYEYGPLRAVIHNRDLRYTFELEPASRVYTAFRTNEHGQPTWSKPHRMKQPRSSGITRLFQTETIDTGERREVFGYVARHVITTTLETRDSELQSQSQMDGWYIDPPAAWLNLHPPLPPGGFCYIYSLGSTSEKDDYKFTETGTRETGFILLRTRTNKNVCRDEAGNPRDYRSVHRGEVTEFSETPLEPDLFVPPPNFKRVPQLPDSSRHRLPYRMRLRWEMFKDSITLPNRIAKFTG